MVPLENAANLMDFKEIKTPNNHFGRVMRREKLEHLVTTGTIGGKRSKGKMWDGLTKWLKVRGVTEALKARRDRDA